MNKKYSQKTSKEQMRLYISSVIEKSMFYKNKYSSREINNFKKSGDLFYLPFTSKLELLEDQQKNPPFGSYNYTPIENIIRIHKTSGTTNKPLLLTYSRKDILETIKIGKKCFELSGLTSKDIVVHCLNYNMWAGGYTDHQSLEATGATVIPFGVGYSINLIETILNIKPTAIHCTPSYLKKLEIILIEEFKLKPRDLNLKLGLFGAEPGIQNPNFRKRIEDEWGIRAMNANYGLSDVLSMFGAECSYQDGLHFMGSGVIFPELIDPYSEQKIDLSNGATGELVLTNLKKESQSLIRYRTNDIIKILSTNRCKCGENSFRFQVIGRCDDMIVIKGINVFMSSVDNLIDKRLEYITGIYQVLVNKEFPIEDIIIRIELKRDIMNSDSLQQVLSSDFKNLLNITPKFEMLPEGSLPRSEGKSKKLLRIL